LINAVLGGAILCVLASCAAPPLATYTLATGQAVANTTPLGQTPVVIAIARVVIPDELDNEDIQTRSGNTLNRSANGRWASRLSIEITERTTARLSERRTDALVTSRPQSQPPSYRIIINLARLDVTTDGHAALQADWVILPAKPTAPVQRNRVAFSIDGPVATDRDVVRLEGVAVDRLSRLIDVGSLD
jgi:uncharacterized lipoprotein YmbA